MNLFMTCCMWSLVDRVLHNSHNAVHLILNHDGSTYTSYVSNMNIIIHDLDDVILNLRLYR